MAKRVIENIQVKTAMGGSVKAPTFNDDGERLFLFPEFDGDWKQVGERPVTQEELVELGKELPPNYPVSEVPSFDHPATVRDVLRNVLRGIPKSAQKPNDGFFIFDMWKQAEFDRDGPIRLSNRAYKWLWSLLERPVKVRVEDGSSDEKSNGVRFHTVSYLRSLFYLDMAPVAFAFCAQDDKKRLAVLEKKIVDGVEEDEDDEESVTVLATENEDDDGDSEK